MRNILYEIKRAQEALETSNFAGREFPSNKTLEWWIVATCDVTRTAAREGINEVAKTINTFRVGCVNMCNFKPFKQLEAWEKVVLSKGGTTNGLFKIEGELLPEEPDVEEDFALGIYRAYVHDSDNIRKCDHCPYNKYNTYGGCGESECIIERNCNEDYDSEILEIVIENYGYHWC